MVEIGPALHSEKQGKATIELTPVMPVGENAWIALVEAEDTARILGRYDEWAGLACAYLMAGASRGLVPLKLSQPQVRRDRIKARYAA